MALDEAVLEGMSAIQMRRSRSFLLILSEVGPLSSIVCTLQLCLWQDLAGKYRRMSTPLSLSFSPSLESLLLMCPVDQFIRRKISTSTIGPRVHEISLINTYCFVMCDGASYALNARRVVWFST